MSRDVTSCRLTNFSIDIVHPSPNDVPQQSYSKVHEKRKSNNVQQSTTKERRGSKATRYSIARRIKSHDVEKNHDNDARNDPNIVANDSLVQNHVVGLNSETDPERPQRQSNQFTHPWFIVLPK